ncbi:WD40 repeat domain-containing protein [Limnoglobus roseus]|uniref:WD40 repeat domain-containing protein n=1 Tax=Limnoglobus roseus TaxID=2598579 RepID=UPI0036F1CA55
MAGVGTGVQAWDAATGIPATGLKLPDLRALGDLRFPISLNETLVGLHGTTLTLTSSAERIVWDATAGTLAGRLPGGYGPIAASPDGKSLVTAGETLQRWDAATGKPVWPDTRDDGHSGLVRSVRFAAGGRKLFSTGSDMTLRAWDVATGAGRVLERGGQGYVVPATPTADGRFVLARRDDPNGPGEIAVVDAASGTTARSIRLQDAAEGSPQYAFLSHVGLTPDGGTAAGVVMVPTADGSTGYAAARWDVATGKYLGRRLMPGVGGYPLSPDQRFAAGSQTPYDAFLFDTTTGARIPLTLDNREVRRRLPVVSPDGRLAAAPTDDGRTPAGHAGVTVWDVATGAKLDRLAAATGLVRFTADGRGLIAADRAGVGVWDLAGGQRVVWHPAPAGAPADGRAFVTAWDATPDGRTLATGHADGTVLLWDVTPPARPAAAPLAAAEIGHRWADLVGTDPAKAYRAGWDLAARPGQAVTVVRANVSPVAAADAEAVGNAAAALDAAAFADRDAAEKELLKLGPAAAPALRKLVAATPSVEQRDRAERVLAAYADRRTRVTPTAADVPGVRAVTAVERTATREALAVLDALAAGAADARLTHEARAAADRLRPAVR